MGWEDEVANLLVAQEVHEEMHSLALHTGELSLDHHYYKMVHGESKTH